MSEDNMGREQQANSPVDIATGNNQTPLTPATEPAQSPTAQEQPSLDDQIRESKHLGLFADIRSLILPSERRRRIEERANESEELFGADLERLTLLGTIHSTIESSGLNSQTPRIDFPDTEDLLDKYANFSDAEKSKARKKIRQQTEIGIKQTLETLTLDLNTLYRDRGASQDEASKQTERFTNPEIKGKRKHFGNLGKNEHIGVLDHTLELRGELLRGNMEHYLYFLSAYQDAAELSDEQIAKIREEFASSGKEEQAILAARVRRMAEKAMKIMLLGDNSRHITGNLERLREFEIMEGMPEEAASQEVDRLRLSFENSSLPQKNKVIEEVLRRKVGLALPHLSEIIRLRSIIEKESNLESEKMGEDADEDENTRLWNEVIRIEDLLLTRLGSSSRFGFGEISTDDMQREIERLVKLSGDPTLPQIFLRIKLLRDSPEDIFYS